MIKESNYLFVGFTATIMVGLLFLIASPFIVQTVKSNGGRISRDPKTTSYSLPSEESNSKLKKCHLNRSSKCGVRCPLMGSSNPY